MSTRGPQAGCVQGKVVMAGAAGGASGVGQGFDQAPAYFFGGRQIGQGNVHFLAQRGRRTQNFARYLNQRSRRGGAVGFAPGGAAQRGGGRREGRFFRVKG